ncbi:MAG: HlyD family type I secretion periplasmic adaptor subunit [Gammaproteobacteria bacterium HGW-Gammaproteobacteria-11]|nr:MAG: HlyD family type I secretion periplasmic adaptor subunit [Gammaproteobacteria bacterium HGW-Gammaproteobacteria-11]
MSQKNPDKPLEQRGFEALGKASNLPGLRNSKLLDRLLKRWLGHDLSDNWSMDAEWARLHQEPARARPLLHALFAAVILLLIWAGFAPLDEVAKGEGRVIPSQQLQIIQSLDGGIVESIHVREGQVIEEGQLLLSIDSTRFMSDLAERQAQSMALRAEIARLRALVSDEPLSFDQALQAQAPELIEDETQLHASSLAELEQQQSIFRNQLIQRQQDLREARAASEQYRTTLDLTSRELERTRPLLASGAVSEVDLLRLERDVANLRGELNRANAAITRSSAAIEEAENKILESRLNSINRWRGELSLATTKLEALEQAETGLRDRVSKTDITAPVRGTVQRLFANTVGGIISPGRDIMEIVPLDDQLLIEARIQPKDIAFVRPGQNAIIKFTAYDFAVFGGLEAVVEHISADTITDDRDNTFYLARLRTESAGFGQDLSIIPGMITQVDIITGKKTVLEYLLKPVLRATSEAMRER